MNSIARLFQTSFAVSHGVINHAFVVGDETVNQNGVGVSGTAHENNVVTILYVENDKSADSTTKNSFRITASGNIFNRDVSRLLNAQLRVNENFRKFYIKHTTYKRII